MARFHLTNDTDSHQQAKGLNENAGLEPYRTLRCENYNISTYQKRALDNENFVNFDNGDFVSVIGTLFYKDKLGSSALRDVYSLFTEQSLKAVRDQCFGHYAVIIKNGNEITVFTDPNGVFETYYVNQETWFVSNSLSICAQCLDERVVDQFRLIQKAVEIAEVSRDTLYNDVYRLLGTEQIVIDLETGELSLENAETPDPDWEYQSKSFDEVVEAHIERLSSLFSYVSNATDGMGMQATGGMDSRTVLGGVLAHGSTPTIMYGVGNSGLTNTKDTDREIATEYANRYNLQFHQMDWSGEYPLSESVWDELFTKHGFRYRTYGATPNFFESLSSDLPDSIDLTMSGYGFGTVSNTYYWEMDSVPPISISEVVREYFSHMDQYNEDEFKDIDEYFDKLINDSAQYLNEIGFSIDEDTPLSLFEFSKAIQLLNGKQQSKYVNTANEFTYHLAPLATYQISRPVLDLPPEYRKGEKIRVNVLRELFPDILEIPLFSGRREVKITSGGEIDSNIRSKWKITDPIPDSMVEVLRSFNHAIEKRRGSDIEKAILLNDIQQVHGSDLLSERFSIKTTDRNSRAVSKLALESYAVDMVGYDEIAKM